MSRPPDHRQPEASASAKRPDHRLGIWGEEQARRHLERLGWKILAQRWRVRGGEVDLVARDIDGVVVFVEVKTRGRGALDDGSAALTVAKRRRLTLAARLWLAGRAGPMPACRFDVVLVRPGAALRHWRGAFDASG